MTNEQSHEIIKAQSELLLHLTERVIMLNCAFEAYAKLNVTDYDEFVELRTQMVDEDFSKGNASALLQTLRTVLLKTDI